MAEEESIVRKTSDSCINFHSENVISASDDGKDDKPVFNMSKRMSRKWSTGAGPRIGCVREYPTELQFRALEQVKLSPRVSFGSWNDYGPIPSPRPSPKVRLSPSVAQMGLLSPRTRAN